MKWAARICEMTNTIPSLIGVWNQITIHRENDLSLGTMNMI